VLVDVWAVPGSSRARPGGLHDGRLRLLVAAPPEDGKANRALQQLLAELSGVPLRQVQLVRGERGRAKTWRITATDAAAVGRRLQQVAAVA